MTINKILVPLVLAGACALAPWVWRSMVRPQRHAPPYSSEEIEAIYAKAQHLDREVSLSKQFLTVHVSVEEGLRQGRLTLVEASDALLAGAQEYRSEFLLRLDQKEMGRNMREKAARHLIGRLEQDRQLARKLTQDLTSFLRAPRGLFRGWRIAGRDLRRCRLRANP